MDHRKEYNEAFKRAKELHEAGNALTKQQMEIVFPELKEIEDEMAINELQAFLASYGADYFGTGQWQKFDDWLEKQKEPLPIPNKFSGLKSLMLQYLQSAANRKDDAEIEDDTDLWGRKILDYVWKYDEKQKEQKPLPPFDEHTPEERMNHPLFLEGFDTGREVQKVFDEQQPAERSLEDDHIIGFVYDLLNEIEWKDKWAMSKEECLRRLTTLESLYNGLKKLM